MPTTHELKDGKLTKESDGAVRVRCTCGWASWGHTELAACTQFTAHRERAVRETARRTTVPNAAALLYEAENQLGVLAMAIIQHDHAAALDWACSVKVTFPDGSPRVSMCATAAPVAPPLVRFRHGDPRTGKLVATPLSLPERLERYAGASDRVEFKHDLREAAAALRSIKLAVESIPHAGNAVAAVKHMLTDITETLPRVDSLDTTE